VYIPVTQTTNIKEPKAIYRVNIQTIYDTPKSISSMVILRAIVGANATLYCISILANPCISISLPIPERKKQIPITIPIARLIIF